jgi:hypothetical protein
MEASILQRGWPGIFERVSLNLVHLQLDTPEALKWFDEHYDSQDYSLWHAVCEFRSLISFNST